MKIKNNFIKIFITVSVIIFSSCETLDLEQLEDQSSLSARFLDPVYTFNYVQLELPNFVDSANDFTQRVTRQMAMTGGNTYLNAFQPINFNRNWASGYLMLNAIKLMETKAVAEDQYYILGASKLIRCYVLASLVDIYGDIPYSESLSGSVNLFPKYDKSADVYKGILAEIEEAKILLSKLGGKNGIGFKDLYYDGSSSWITFANTLKIKMYNNARLAGADIGVSDTGAAINAIVLAGDYIDKPSEDFAFRYGSNRNNPNSRHPLYNDQYELGGGAYISNYIMWAMTEEKKDPFQPTTDIVDPRTEYYFCKQDSNPSGEEEFVLPKGVRPSHYSDSKYDSFYVGSILAPYKVSNWIGETRIPTNGFWGRDHGDNSGIPPDNEKRTCAGVYPIGGKFVGLTTPTSVQKSGVDGALGAGIMPILLSSYVHFMLAETSLMSSSYTATNARAEFLLGVSNSVEKTTKFVIDYPKVPSIDLPSEILNHETFLKKIYDAVSNEGKLELVIKEFFIASWGNGFEPYNNYRRTGFPSNFQPTLEPTSGDYYYTAFYPTSAVNNNPNAPVNSRTRKVFWDKGNLILH